MTDEAVDLWLKPYERPNDTTKAMEEYLAWEFDLLQRIERDGTTNFTLLRRCSIAAFSNVSADHSVGDGPCSLPLMPHESVMMSRASQQESADRTI